MKIRLLTIFAAIVAATSVGWSQNVKTITYYSIGTSEGNGSEESPYVKASLDEALTAINTSQTDSVVLRLPDGTYSATASPFSITKSSVAIIGKDTNSVTITSPFDITLASGGAVSFSGIHLNAETGVGRGVVDIKSSNTIVSFTNSKVTISGTGTNDGGSTVCFGIVSGTGDINNNTINFRNSNMFMPNRCQRGIAFRDGNGHTLNFIHSIMEGPAAKSGYDYVIGLCSWPSGTQNVKPVTYTISDSRIDICYYAVFINNQTAVPVEINIDNSDITAWSALYLRGDGVKSDPYSFSETIKVTNSNLTGRSYMNGPSDGFSTIVFEACPGIDMTIDSKSTILSKHLDPQQVPAITMDLVQMRNTQGNITFTSGEGEKCKIHALNTAYSPIAFNISDNDDKYKKPSTDVKILGIENTTILNGKGVPYISIFKSDGSFYNAVADITTLLTGIPIADGDKVFFPEGTFTLPQSFTLDKSLTIEGAGKEKTIIKGHIEVNPEEGKTATLTAKGLTLEGTNASATHGIIGIIGAGTGKVDLTDCKISGGALTGQAAAVGVRMESVGAELAMKNTDIDVYYYGLGLREKNQKVTINGCSIIGRAAIMTSAGGLNGYLDPTGTSITATGTTFIGKTIAQGEGESYGTIALQEKYNGVIGEFSNCQIKTVPAISAVAGAEKQMSALCVRSYGNTLNFNGGMMSAVYAENNIAGINSKIHAAVISLGWHNADFIQSVAGATELKGDDTSTPSQNTIKLTNCDLTIKEGEKYLATTYRRDINQKHDALTINGTAYSVDAGNVLKLYQVDKNGKFVDDNGNLISQVTDLASLKSIIASVSDGSTIHLSGDITGIAEGDLPIVVKKAITLEGNGYTLAGTYPLGGGTALKHLLEIQSNNVVIRNLTVEKAPRSGINVYDATGVRLENVVSQNNASVGLTVNGSVVTATNLTTSSNGWAGVNVDKGKNVESNPVFTFSNSSLGEAVAIYSDLPDAPLSYVVAPANSGWTKHANQGDVVKKTIWKIDALVPTITTIPEIKVNLLEAGQTLSSILLVKGVAQYNNAAISGTFSWDNPAEIIKTGKNDYKVLFTPSDLIKYTSNECKVSIDAQQYYTVTTGVCQNGKVSITNGNVNNRYAAGTELTLTSTPNARYRLKAGSLASKMTVTEDATITAEFEAIQQTVTLKVEGGNGSISVNGKTNHDGSVTVQQGIEIVVQANPSDDYVLESLSCTGGKVISKDAVTVDKDFTITATFKTLPAQEYSVKVTSPANGKILLFDGNGNAIAAGSSVVSGTTVSVLAVADEGYKLKAKSLKNNESEIANGVVTVTGNAVIIAVFEIQKFEVVSSASEGGSITLTQGESTGFTSGNKVDYGQTMKAKVTPTNGYKLLSLLVNGKEIPDGGSFTVKAATTVKAVMRKLATITIDETAQTFVYDGTAKAFVVKTTPSGIGGFTVTSSSPKEVNSYSVTIKRPADDTYAAFEKTITNGLVVTKAEMKGVAVPIASNGSIQNSTVADGEYAWNAGNDSDPIRNAIFTPTNRNYAPITFSIPTGKGNAQKVTYDWGNIASRSALRTKAQSEGSLSITAEGAEGSILILNGNSQLSSGNLYATQKIRLRAIPGAKASANVSWTVSGGTLDKTAGNEVTLTLGEGANIVTATFAAKKEPTSPTISGDLTYNGGIQVPTITGGTDWQITFKQGSQIIQNPTDAGVYDVIASYPEDANYKAVTDKKIGTFTIKPKAVTATVTAASSILQGQSLAQSVITGTANADGTFEWNTDTKNTPITTSGTQVSQPIKFVPTSTNYEELTGLSTSVEVTKVEGLTLRTLNLTVTNPDGGTVTMKLNGQEVNSGATITEGDKLTVDYQAKSNYNATVSVVGATNAENVYTVGDAGNVEVKVTFTLKFTPDDDDEPEVVAITGVTLDPSSKTVAVGEEFELTVSVKPAYADQSVTWSSSDETVAIVKQGTVKALKAGKATITATASDDTHYAECEVTVSFAIGIDELISSNRIQGCDGYIMIEPIAAIETLVTDMMGRIIYHSRLTEKIQLPVSEGVYLVRLSNNEKAVTVKVIVR